jgi:hypothetical protein
MNIFYEKIKNGEKFIFFYSIYKSAEETGLQIFFFSSDTMNDCMLMKYLSEHFCR